MKTFIRTSTLGVGAAVMVLIGASAAYASGTYLSVNGSTGFGSVPFTATNATNIVFNTNFDTKTTCTNSSISGEFYSGEVTSLNLIGTIDSISFSSCSMGIFGLNLTMTAGDIEVRNDPPGPGADIDVTITNVHGTIAGTSGGTCMYDVTGSLDAVLRPGTGNPDATLELVSATVSPDAGFDLTISNVNGCGGEVVNGDLAGPWDSDKVFGIPSTYWIDTTGPVTHS